MPGGKRDRLETKRRLIAAVGSLLQKHGYKSLGVNKIAAEADVSKPMIYDYFETPIELIHAYIKDKDYWLPLFDELKLPDITDQEAVQALITTTIQDQFRFFLQDKEMQKLILWQISEDNALLRKVSDRREEEGAKILGLADKHFFRSKIDHKALTALLVGGIYYLVLHQQSNGSTVCGIDISREKDRQSVLDSIAQVLDWAWSNAKTKQIKHTYNMNITYEYEFLESLTAQLVKRQETETFAFEADPTLKNEARKMERILLLQFLSLTNETQINSFLQFNLNKLVNVCNRLYRKDNPNHNAQVILELLDAIRKPGSGFIPANIELPKLFIDQRMMEFDTHRKAIHDHLVAQEIDPRLTEIVDIPFKRFVDGKDRLVWQDYKYLRRYAHVLERNMDEFPLEQHHLIELLIGLGFNHSRFTSFHARLLRDNMQTLNPAERRTMLMLAKTKINQTESLTRLVFEVNKKTVVEEIVRWIDAEITNYPQTMFGPSSNKLNSKFRAIELAFWMKLLYDHNVFEEVNLDVYCDKIAANFTTVGQDDLSGPSLKSKLYSKEPAVIETMEKLLVGMLEEVRRFRK